MDYMDLAVSCPKRPISSLLLSPHIHYFLLSEISLPMHTYTWNENIWPFLALLRIVGQNKCLYRILERTNLSNTCLVQSALLSITYSPWCQNAYYDMARVRLSWVSSHLHRSSRYNDVIMSVIASQITSLTIVYSTVYSGANQRKHQSSASLAFVRGIHR